MFEEVKESVIECAIRLALGLAFELAFDLRRFQARVTRGKKSRSPTPNRTDTSANQ